jgi:membrane protein YdbS with pleckstrin-like domain
MTDFTNNTIDINSLPKYEEVPLQQLSNKYWKVVLINIFLFQLFLAAGILTFLAFNEHARAYLAIIIIAYFVFAALMIVLYNIGLKRRGFAIREKDIIYASGVLALSTTIVPFSRIQHIALHEGMIPRFFKLGELQIFTAGGKSGSLHIPGVEIEEAKRIKALLMHQINDIDNTPSPSDTDSITEDENES